MLMLITFIAFVLAFMVVNLMFVGASNRKAKLDRRIMDISERVHIAREDEDKSLKEKVLDSVGAVFEKQLGKNSKGQRHDALQKKLDSAGMGKNTTPIRYMTNMIIMAGIVAISTAIILSILTRNTLTSIFIGLLAMGVYLYMKRLIILRRTAQRRAKILKDLAYSLDLILVSVEAGLSFDGAISKVVASVPGPISEEFGKTLKEIRMGIERKIALRNMSARCNVKELNTFITSIIQADELGVALSKIIRIEAAALREERKQRAREKAMKAPVKILIPLILFVFPTIFVVVLGPALINIMETFSK